MKFSPKKLSLLGLVLMGASAVTAAIIPNKPEAKFDQGGSLTQANGTADPAAGDEWSCTITNGQKAACNITATTETTDDAVENNSFTNEDVNPRQTANNTTTIPA